MYSPLAVLILVNCLKVCQLEVIEVGAHLKQVLLDIHNKYRSTQSSSDMQKLTWSNTLADEAQSWIKRCVFDHERKERGENLAYNTHKGITIEEKINTALKSWYDEIYYYNYNGKICGSSCHYTQMVWANTSKVGCAMEQCGWLTRTRSPAVQDAWYLACFYFPRGNYITRYPFSKGTACSKCKSTQSCDAKGLCIGGPEVDLFPCQNKNHNCKRWKESGQCSRNRQYMKQECAKECGFCQKIYKSKEEPSPKEKQNDEAQQKECKDLHQYCGSWAANGDCERNPGYMINNCRKSCRVCDEEKPACVDQSTRCKHWARMGECWRNPGVMLESCKKSCRACKVVKEKTGCMDKNKDCYYWANYGECERNPGYMLSTCRKSCNACTVVKEKTSCVDKNKDCYYWASYGQCERNPGYMLSTCRKSCNACTGCVDGNQGCANLAKYGECNNNPDYMRTNCRKSCNVC